MAIGVRDGKCDDAPTYKNSFRKTGEHRQGFSYLLYSRNELIRLNYDGKVSDGMF